MHARGWSIRTRIILLVLSINLVAVGSLGYLSYSIFFSTLLQKEVELLGLENRRNAISFSDELKTLKSDVLYLAETIRIGEIAEHAEKSNTTLQKVITNKDKKILTNLFVHMLELNPTYLQVRFLDASGAGQELVRVDKLSSGLSRVIPDDELQLKSKELYFQETLKREVGDIYISDFNLNREHGKIEIPHKPVIRACSPIYSKNGSLLGMVVINKSAVAFLSRFKKSSGGRRSYIVDNNGRFLVHPDPTKSFEFEYREVPGILESYPVLFKKVLEASTSSNPTQLRSYIGPLKLIRSAAINFSIVFLDKKQHRFITLINSSSTEPIVARLRQLKNRLLLSGLLILFATIAIGFWIGNRITLPIVKLVGAVRSFGDEKTIGSFPSADNGEVGDLIRAFQGMISKIEEEISERKAAEQLFSSIIDLSPSGLLLVNARFQIVLANDKIEEIFGYTSDEIKGEGLDSLIPAEFKEKHRELATEYFLNGEVKDMALRDDIVGIRKDGRIVPLEVGLVRVVLRGENYVLAAINDVSIRKEAENLLKSKNKELEQANEDLESFAYTASHDLNAPLARILQAAEILEEQLGNASLTEGQKKLLSIINRGGSQMINLVKDLLQYSKTGRSQGSFASVDLNEVANEALSNLDAKISESNAQIEIQELPVIIGDRTSLVQLFQNLISNGIKFKGERESIVKIYAKKKGSGWEIFVKDNGIGIALENQAKIFKAFERLHTVKEYDGTGIGLATCVKVVEQHNGKIKVQSREGEGAEFVVFIPTLEL